MYIKAKMETEKKSTDALLHGFSKCGPWLTLGMEGRSPGSRESPLTALTPRKSVRINITAFGKCFCSYGEIFRKFYSLTEDKREDVKLF
jgi:hypothetical protein